MLTARGYRLRNGNPFILANRRGKLVPNFQALSRAFNNWFYAGWIVVPSEWADIKPKTLRGNWEPIVSTEEFEHGLQLLARRRQKPFAQKRNFYLLQGLVHLQHPNSILRRMSCSRSNIKRTEKGVAYYRIAGQEQRVVCTDVDEQIPHHLESIQVDPEQMPAIRRTYQQDVQSNTSISGQESRSLKDALARAKDKELNLWRAYTQHGMHNDVYLKLAQEIQQERTNIEYALQSLHQESSSHIEDLDMALHLSQIGERYRLLDRTHQRELLHQLVSKVAIDERGKIIRLELLPPFIYLQAIANGTQILVENGQIAGKIGQQADFPCSTRIGLGPPKSPIVIFFFNFSFHTDLALHPST